MLLLIVLGITGLALIWNKNIYVLFPAILGLIISVPGWIKWVKFLLYGMPISEVEVIKSISREGYSIGQFFTMWTYRDDHPGLGLPLSIACILLIWCLFVDREVKIMEKQGFFLFVFLLMSFMSMKCFPWEMIQRLTGVFLRLVSAFETPTVFWGFASLSACVLGAYGVELTRRGKYVLFRE